MRLRHLVWGFAGLALALLPDAVLGKPLVRIEASCLSSGQRSQVTIIRIDRIRAYRDDTLQAAADTLVLPCPSNDILFWRTVLVVGDTIGLSTRVTASATRGWLFFGYRPEELEVLIPEGGIVRVCDCKSKADRRKIHFKAEFQAPDGSLVASLSLQGTGMPALARLVPFLKGHRAQLPQRVVLFLSYDEEADNQPGTRAGKDD